MGVPPSPTDVWAVGETARHHPAVERWDGQAWALVPTSELSRHTWLRYQSVSALSPNDVWATGFLYNLRTEVGQNILDHWDGSTWTRIDGLALGPGEGISDVSAISPSDVWVVGHTVGATLAEHYDGSSWTRVSTPATGLSSSLSSISAVSSSEVWAAGQIHQGDHPTTYDAMMLHWDGSTWTQVAIKGGRAPRNTLTSVSADASNDAWVFGYSASKPIVRHWDGSTWS